MKVYIFLNPMLSFRNYIITRDERHNLDNNKRAFKNKNFLFEDELKRATLNI